MFYQSTEKSKKKKSESFFSPANYPPYKTPDQPQGQLYRYDRDVIISIFFGGDH